jgi:FtsX-like permease family
MGAIWLRATAQLRGRVRASLLLILLVGLSGGVVLAALAGARRSEAALPRFLAAYRTADTLVSIIGPRNRPGEPARNDLATEVRAVAGLPQVRTARRVCLVILSGSDPTTGARPSRQLALVGLDGVGHEAFGRPMVVAGRLPRPDRADEAAVDEEFAWRHGLRAGTAFRVGTYTRAQFGSAGAGAPVEPAGPAVDLRVTGILRAPDDLLPVAERRDEVDADESSLLSLTPAFWWRHGPDLANFGSIIAVDLRRDHADLPAFTTAVQRRLPGQAFVSPGEFVDGGTGIPAVRRAITLETTTLLAFAALAAVAAVLLVGQTLGRQVFLESAEYPSLRALGMTRRQLVGVALVRTAVIAGTGAGLAMATALALSPLTPIGVARRGELDPGVAADWPVLLTGGLVILALVLVGAALPAWRAAGNRGDAFGVVGAAIRRRPSGVVEALASTGAPPSAITGVRMALEPGRGRTAVPVRAAMAGATAAVCAVVATGGFGVSLARLAGTPVAYGVTWDVAVGGVTSPTAGEAVAGRLLANPRIAAVAGMLGMDVTIDGRPVPILAIEERKGWLPPAVVEGREPLRPGEIALGSTTLKRLGRRIGDTVTVAAGDRSSARSLRVVGRVVLHQPGWDSVITPGSGGILHPDDFRRLAPDPAVANPGRFLVRFVPGADREAAVAGLRRELTGFIFTPRPHAEVRNLQRVGGLPALLAALVALLALATLAHTLVTSVRRRHRDLAVLKSLGFVRGQVAATIAWQATTFAVVALAIGVPLGLAAGRWAWQLTADALGVDSGAVVPWPATVAVVAGTLVAANLAAAVPGRAASRLRPAAALRTE